ncbi:MAG: hypothetical protein B5M54_05730 [Candidatus Aminicenantes bacterium 4484_214]|nr:MAG: hypothetical protein B5M54_05730 [Candidatus Aminicenantes bacterium 4484_214]RLE08775.1 MAG: hypothetical protein DRJ06_04045 [Candidatus Aminicenantes bacterium]
MNFKVKIIIVLVAVILSFLLFNLMTSTNSVELMTVGKKAGLEIIANYLARTTAPLPHLM